MRERSEKFDYVGRRASEAAPVTSKHKLNRTWRTRPCCMLRHGSADRRRAVRHTSSGAMPPDDTLEGGGGFPPLPPWLYPWFTSVHGERIARNTATPPHVVRLIGRKSPLNFVSCSNHSCWPNNRWRSLMNEYNFPHCTAVDETKSPDGFFF